MRLVHATLFSVTTMNTIAINSVPPARTAMSSDESLSFSMPSIADCHRLLTQLQSRYPAGVLITELAHAGNGQFVVRALVQVGNATISTGLASAESVEVAEDRAKVRALAALGISLSGMVPPTLAPKFEVQAQLMPEPPQVPQPPQVLDPPVQPAFESLPETVLPPVEALVPEVKSEPVKKVSRKKKEETPVEELLSFQPLELPEPEPLPSAVEIDYAPDDLEEEVPEPVSEPIDLSDAIAQIGAEIERIGWTKKQGSTYLQETYGKKTRAELTEDELLEFLHYLKALPSKDHPSMSLPF